MNIEKNLNIHLLRLHLEILINLQYNYIHQTIHSKIINKILLYCFSSCWNCLLNHFWVYNIVLPQHKCKYLCKLILFIIKREEPAFTWHTGKYPKLVYLGESM